MTYTPGGAGLPDLPLNTEVESGRKIYGEDTFFKALEFVGNVPASTTQDIAHGVTGLKRVVRFGGVITDDDGDHFDLSFGTSASAFGIQLQADATNVTILTGSGWTGAGNLLKDPRIVIEYTKT